MSREIKFRVWDKENTELFGFRNYRGLMFLREDGVLHRQEAGMGGTSYNGEQCYCSTNYPLQGWKFEARYVIQQFTGLRDKNNKEIYEGDIITYKEKMHEHGDIQQLNAQVIYDSMRAAFAIAGLSSGEIWNYFTDMTISDFEVVGNIFEK